MGYADPETRARYQSEYYERNRDELRAKMKVWWHSDAGKSHKFRRTLRRYGLTQECWDQLWDQQAAKCAGCIRPLVLGASTHIDHCHVTGRVRGLLCSECNLAIGKLRDSVSTLRRLADYLEKDRG